jgi:hypothetical protein
VRDLELRIANLNVVKKQDVEIERTRAVANLAGPVAAELVLDGQQAVEQCARFQFGFERNHRVDESRLSGEADR